MATALRGIFGWAAGTLFVYGVVLASQSAGDWVLVHSSQSAVVMALRIPFHLVMAPVIFALQFRWPRLGVTAVALLSLATWGALVALAARALVTRRRRAK